MLVVSSQHLWWLQALGSYCPYIVLVALGLGESEARLQAQLLMWLQ